MSLDPGKRVDNFGEKVYSKFRFFYITSIIAIVLLSIKSILILVSFLLQFLQGGVINSFLFSNIIGVLVTIAIVVFLIIGFIGLREFLPITVHKEIIISTILLVLSGIFSIITFFFAIFSSANNELPLSKSNIPIAILQFVGILLYAIALVFINKLMKEITVFLEFPSRGVYSSFAMFGVLGVSLFSMIIALTGNLRSDIFPVFVSFLDSLVFIAVYVELYLIFRKIIPQISDEQKLNLINHEYSINKPTTISSSQANHPEQFIETGNVSEKNKMNVLLLCLIFGGMGVHRFYVGKMPSGVLYLCTGGLLGFGVLYDLFIIFMDKFTDGEEKLITDNPLSAKSSVQPTQVTTPTETQPQIHPVMKEAVSKAVEETLATELAEKISFMSPGEVVNLQEIATYYGCNKTEVENTLKALLSSGQIFGSLNPFNGTFTVK